MQARAAAAEQPGPGQPTGDKLKPHDDELQAYLALPQIENTSEWAGLEWWEEQEPLFPNLSLMARQYLGCPGTSATVERLFSSVGLAFEKKRRRNKASSLEDRAFIVHNL